MKIYFRFVCFQLIQCSTVLFGPVRFSKIKISNCAPDLIAKGKIIPIPVQNRVNGTHCIWLCYIPVNIPYFQTICSQIQSSHEKQQQLDLSLCSASLYEDLVPKALEHSYVSLTTSTIILLAIKKRGYPPSLKQRFPMGAFNRSVFCGHITLKSLVFIRKTNPVQKDVTNSHFKAKWG